MAGPVRTPIVSCFRFRSRSRTRSLPSRSHSPLQPNFTIPEDPDDFETSSDYYSAVSIALMGFQFIASQCYIPGIVVVFDAAIQLTNALRDAKWNSHEACRLVKTASDYTNLVMEHATELSSIPSASQHRQNVETHLASFVKITSKIVNMAGHMGSRGVFTGVFSVNSDKEVLRRFQQKLEHALNTFQTKVLSHIDQNVHHILDEVEALHHRIDDMDRNFQQVRRAFSGADPFLDDHSAGGRQSSEYLYYMDDLTKFGSNPPMNTYLTDEPPSYC